MTEKKITFETEIKCPHCKKFLIVKNEKTILTEAVKAEYEEKVVVEKS
ncbi:unnamed protein product, partial [marine sediment metagenome]